MCLEEISISVTFGRFNPLTIEHQKVLDANFNSPGEKKNKYVFVFGKNENPLSLNERLIYINHLYSTINIIPCSKKHCESPLMALVFLYQKYKVQSSNLVLNIYCGKGNNGIYSSSKKGASDIEIERILKTYNKTKFNDGSTRMWWNEYNIHTIERGNYSGTFVRQLAKTLDFCNDRDVYKFKQYLHSKINFEYAATILKKLNI